MNIFNRILKVNRKDRFDTRKLGQIRCDRNEKVSDWDKNIINKISKNITKQEFTSYFNPKSINDISKRVSKYLGVSNENFCYFHGGDSVIRDFIIFNYRKNLTACINDHNYQMYDVYLNSLKIRFKKVRYLYNEKNINLFNLDKQQLYKLIPKADIIFYTNPNQISNFDIKLDEFEKFLKRWKTKKFFIDESYYGFGHVSFINLVKKYKNLYILRSATKSLGMAPHRIGFLISHKENIKKFKYLQTPYPLSIYSGKILDFFLKNRKLIKEYQQSVRLGREYLVKKLRQKGYKVNNSMGNCIFLKFDRKKNMNKFFNYLKKNNFITKKSVLDNKYFIRITCDKKQIMQKILNIVK